MENNLKLKEEKLLAIDLNKVDNNSEPTQNDSNINSKTDIDNNITKLNQSSSNNQKISNNNTKLNQNNSNNSKPRTKPDQSKNSKKLNQSNAKPSQNDTNNTKTADNKNEIKKVYGGEISASENGIMTEEDILYAVNKIAESENWFPEEVENIKEMIPALLEIQIENDVCPLAPIALAHWESHCGLDYEARKEIRYFNTTPWKGRIGDNGVSEGGYLTYYTTELAIKDFGKYLREGPPYTESPALTMQDLRAHGVYTWIFGGAGEEGQNTFNKLKGYLEKRVDKEDISKMVEGCTTSEIKDFSNTLIDEQKLANKEMSEIGE